MTESLRERIAKAMFDAGRVDRGSEYGAVDWQYIRGRHRESWLRLADAAIAEAGLAPAGGTLTATPDVRAAIERMVDGTDTGEDRNVVRRWLGR